MLQYRPLGHPDLEIAVVTTETDGVVTALTIYFRTLVSLVDPVTYASDLDQEIISEAGISESAVLSDFHLASQETRGTQYHYSVTAVVTV
jgi:hypothetical protein